MKNWIAWISGLVLILSVIAYLSLGSKRTSSTEVQAQSEPKIVSDTLKHSECSVITCPNCGFQKSETLPTEICLLKYTCTSCRADLQPKPGDCCVFCTYGTQKCPSMQ